MNDVTERILDQAEIDSLLGLGSGPEREMHPPERPVLAIRAVRLPHLVQSQH